MPKRYPHNAEVWCIFKKLYWLDLFIFIWIYIYVNICDPRFLYFTHSSDECVKHETWGHRYYHVIYIYIYICIHTNRFCPVSWSCRIHQLHLCRGVRLLQGVSCIWHSTIWWWGSSDAGAWGNAEYPFIAIAPRSTLPWNGSTW